MFFYETSKDEENNKIPYVTTFNPHNPEIFPEIFPEILKKNHFFYAMTEWNQFMQTKQF